MTGDDIRHEREMYKMPLAEMARRIGVSEATLAGWERDNAYIPPEVKAAVDKAFRRFEMDQER